MKRLNLTLILCLAVFLLSAQDYFITFSGSGESNTVSNVIVENMTQGKSLTLNGNDVLHLKSTVTEISEVLYNQTEGIQFYPNPMKEFSVMEFVMTEEGDAKIELFDISGRKLMQTQNYLNPGRHSYRITGIASGIYVLKVSASNYSFSGKLISEKKTGEMVNIIYLNTISFSDNQAVMKSGKTEIQMQYNTGDLLKFYATGGEHKSVKVDVISESKIVDFVFYKCTDPDNRNYATVKIGNQIWMAENLAYLTAVSPPKPGSNTTPHYYVYDYTGTNLEVSKKTVNYITYGVIYNWSAAKIACPSGWHLPSDEEWIQLEKTLGMTQTQTVEIGWRGNNQGTQMKSTLVWNNEGQENNFSGFSALPSGFRYVGGAFGSIETWCGWWIDTQYSATNAWYRALNDENSNVHRNNMDKSYGLSVRCVKD